MVSNIITKALLTAYTAHKQLNFLQEMQKLIVPEEVGDF